MKKGFWNPGSPQRILSLDADKVSDASVGRGRVNNDVTCLRQSIHERQHTRYTVSFTTLVNFEY